jgi:uncharacterized protein (TIGR01319 family)
LPEKPLTKNLENVRVILATDCGSTTSKARLFKKLNEEYRFVASGEAPTTVEAPLEDVTIGVRNAIREVEELTGHKLLSPEGVISPSTADNAGVDLYITTSSAGGGLQMMVAGITVEITASTAERTALGAGAIVMDVMAYDDGREVYQKIQRLRSLRPDMILIAGGTDESQGSSLSTIGEMLLVADPKPRLGSSFKLPIIFAGSVNAREAMKKLLGGKFALRVVDNVRPSLNIENLEPARALIHEFFMEHVMSQAPGYSKLIKWTPVPIMPTPLGEGAMFQTVAKEYGVNLLGAGLGGATTNIYSLYKGNFLRTVSANLGMSYSLGNVLKEAKVENIKRWLPFEVDESRLCDKIANKVVHPTTVPQTLEDLMIEQASAREALRLSFQHHQRLVQSSKRYHIDLMKFDLIGGTGGLLSNAPRRIQSALMLIDGFLPEGITRLIQDSVFMMPHLGVLLTYHPQAAMQILEKDCLIKLGTCIALQGQLDEGGDPHVGRLTVKTPDGRRLRENIVFGTIKRLPLGVGEVADVDVRTSWGFSVGGWLGRLRSRIEGGVAGIIIDARGRPLLLPDDEEGRRRKIIEWFMDLDLYPREALKEMT